MERRRTILRGCGTAILAGLSGCTGSESDPEPTDDGIGDDDSGDSNSDDEVDIDDSGDSNDDEPVTEPSIDVGWTSHGSGPGATNAVPEPGPAETPTVDWTYSIPGGSGVGDTFVPAVADGTVYVPSIDDGTLHVAAVDAEDGTERWQRSIDPDWYVDLDTTTTPALTESSLVVGYDRGTVSLSRIDGTVQWHRPLDLTRPVVDDGVLFGLETFARTDTVYALDPETGDEHWSRDVDSGDGLFGPLVDDERCYSFDAVDRNANRIVAHDRSGDVEWTGPADQRLLELPAVRDDRLVAPILTGDGAFHVIGIDTDDGTERWRLSDVPSPSFAVGPEGVCVVSRAGGESTTSQVVLCDSADGTVRWRREVDVRFPDVVAGDGTLYLHSFPDSTVVALETETGDELWRGDGLTLADVSVGADGIYETETGELRCYR